MNKTSLKNWFLASRPFTLTASAIPVIIGGVLPLKDGIFNPLFYILSILGILLMHGSVNMLNDHDDFLKKVDTKDSFGSSKVVTDGTFTALQVRNGGLVLLAVGSIIGSYLALNSGIWLYAIGIVGAITVYSYSGKPIELKYHGLGLPAVFIVFGPLMVISSYYVQTAHFSWESFFVSIPLGLLTTAILHANDIRDMAHDKLAGISTLSIKVGLRIAKVIYYMLIVLAYSIMAIMIIFKITPLWSVITFVTLPEAIKKLQKLSRYDGKPEEIAMLDVETAQMQAKFGLLVLISIIISLVF